MTTTVSIAPTVAAALKTQLATVLATSGLDGKPVDVFDSFPSEYVGWDTCIIGDVVDGKHEYHSIRAGRKTRQETYVQHVWFRVIRGGSESTDAKVAAFTHLAKLEDLIANDPKIGLSEVTLVMNVQGFTLNTTQEAGSGGWLAALKAEVYVSVRLT